MAFPEPTVTLNSGNKIPLIGFGTWKANPGEAGESVKQALEAGYRHIDCAAVYGNEAEIGNALTEVFSAGKIKREDVFITSKLWNTCHKPENVFKAIKQTLKDLQLTYLDLYLIHFPCAWEFTALPIGDQEVFPRDAQGNIVFEKTTLEQTWHAMEDVRAQGLVKDIGISNFPLINVADLLASAKVPPAVQQIEVHPYNVRADLIGFTTSRGIHVTAYSPLGSGREGPLQDPVIVALAAKYGKSPAQIALAWSVTKGISVIPKSVTVSRIKENFAVDFKLAAEDVAKIDALDRKLVVVDTKEYWNFPLFA